MLKFLIISVRLSNLFLTEFISKWPILFVVGYSRCCSLIFKPFKCNLPLFRRLLVLMLLCIIRSIYFWLQAFSNELFTFSAFSFSLSPLGTIAESTTFLSSFFIDSDVSTILSAIISGESFVDKLFVPT